jgi:hypothetical protein
VRYVDKLSIPEIDKIIEEAESSIAKKYNVKSLRDVIAKIGFSNAVNELEEEAFRIYRDYEKKAVEEYFGSRGFLGKPLTFELISEIIDDSIIISIANARRSRAGRTVERILIEALKALEVPCEEATIEYQGYKPDIVVPSNKAFGSKEKPNIDKVFVLAVKRTLRERWSEDIRVFNFPNSAFVFIKPDPDFTPQKAIEMALGGMKRVYVPDSLYSMYEKELDNIMKQYNVVFKPLSQLPEDLCNFLKRVGIRTLFTFL